MSQTRRQTELSLQNGTIMITTIEDYREQRRRLPFLPYENLVGHHGADRCGIAEKVLDSGWKIGPYDSFLLDTIPWESSEKISRSWSFQIHSWHMLDDLLAAYSVSGEKRFFDPALGVALDWAMKFSSFETPCTFAWYDMAVGLRAYRLAYIIDAAARLDEVPDIDFSSLLDALARHRKYLSEEGNIAFHSNHGFYQAAGQLAMARRLKDLPGMERAMKQALERFRKILAMQFSLEGVHLEHSPDYHWMICQALRGILDANIFDDEDITASCRKIEESLSWFVMPHGYLANFGDSDYRRMFINSACEARWKTPAMIYSTSGGLHGKPPDKDVRVFESAGYFIARTWNASAAEECDCGSYLAQTLAFHSRTHKHADDLSFIWFDRGSEILMDTGRYGYHEKTAVGSDLWRDGFWYRNPNRIHVESTCAHNTVEIDGRSYQRKGVKPYGSALSGWGQSRKCVFVEGQVRLFRTIRFHRNLVYVPGKWLLVYDWLWDNNRKNHVFRQWFHFAPSIRSTKDGNRLILHLGGNIPLQMVSLVEGPALTEVFRGKGEPGMQGWFSPREGEMIPSDAVAYEVREQPSVVFATLLAFTGDLKADVSWSRVNVTGRKARFRWSADGVSKSLLIDRSREGDGRVTFTDGGEEF